ncbi:hypothetical protein TNCV_2517751 [Trichonephila clavipes]|nr:hypothetical protein TNCV_2517751 [Trichonephila clavipes]
MSKLRKTPAGLNCSILLSEEFVAVGNNNMCIPTSVADKDILEFVQSLKSIIDADSVDENEANNAAPVPMSSEMRNIVESNTVDLKKLLKTRMLFSQSSPEEPQVSLIQAKLMVKEK